MSSVIDRIGDMKLRMNNEAGRWFFGNTVRFSDNVRGLVREKRAQYKSNVQITPDHENAAKLRNFGFVELGQVYDKMTIERIEEQFDRLIEDDNHSFMRDKNREARGYSRQLSAPVDDIPEILELITDDLIETLESYYGSHFQMDLKRLRAWRNYHVPPEIVDEYEAFSNYWHCDRHPTDRIKYFVYLTDVTEDDGPFHLISKPETKRIVKKEGIRVENRHEQGIPGGIIKQSGNVIKFTGSAGNAALCNTQRCLHRAGIPAEGRYRDIIQFQFTPATEPITDQISSLR